MKIVCPVKFTPDVDSFVYDYEKQELIRENTKQIIGPDDACALGFALKIKKEHPDITIEAVTMAPLSILEEARNLARRGIDEVTVLSDPAFALSDTLATSRVLKSYIGRLEYDVILTGSRTLDGDTGHIPAQLAALLGLECMSGITRIDEASFLEKRPVIEVDTELDTQIYEIALPAVLGVSSRSGYRLPFVRYADLDLDVSRQLKVLRAEELDFKREQAGAAGSATKVAKTYTQSYAGKKERIFVHDDEEGVECVFRFLKEKGYLL